MQRKKIKYVPPVLFRKLFPATIWNAKTDKILLTFDDGPNEVTTPLILAALKKHSVKGVFFCVGENILRYPEITKEIIKQGHMLANHTMTHRKIFLFNDEAENDIALCSQAIKDITGTLPRYFRAPYGRIGLRTEKLLYRQSLINVMWSLIPYDYKNDFNIISFAVSNYLTNNSIVVLHDNVKSKTIIKKAIDYIIQVSEQKGFTIGEPNECLK